MTPNECAIDVGVSRQAVHRWIKIKKIPTKRIGLRGLFIEPEVWADFCEMNNIKRGMGG